ncbi:hypothetical protein [Amantichitinum ursilacus]|uniref:Lipoprotein n=1 Tax=Amantichitinum ursilacus TaxID=857265 RepID=A0A0N0GM72_9NEIS|nr:hypothetical protein [Amantichitinum ursilacus]KPC50806.1 hypothetical protein WG78_15960 [Amantichitinum ursilacus]
MRRLAILLVLVAGALSGCIVVPLDGPGYYRGPGYGYGPYHHGHW